MNAKPRLLTILAILIFGSTLAVALPPEGGEQQPTGEIPLVDSQEDYDRMTALMPRVNRAISQYIAQSTQSVLRGYEMGSSSFRTWCQQNEQAIQGQISEEVLGRVLQAAFGTLPPGVSGRNSPYMQGLHQQLSSMSSGSFSGSVRGFLSAHQQAVQRATSGLSGYAQRFENAHADVITAARHQLLAGLQERQADPEHEVELDPATVNVLRQAGVPTPGSATIHAFAQGLLTSQVRALGPAVESGSSESSAQLSDEQDRELAQMESTYRESVDDRSPCALIARARQLDEYLMHPSSPMGPCQRAEIASALIRIMREIERRRGTPMPGDPPIECTGWGVEDPLEGDLTAISPFGGHDGWTAIEAAARRECPERSGRDPDPVPTPRVRDRGRTSSQPVRPSVRWTVERMSSLQDGEGVLPPPPQEGDYIVLSITNPTRREITDYNWEVVSVSNGNRPTIQQVSPSRSVFRVGPRAPTYVVQAVVSTRRGRLQPARLTINTAEAPPPPRPEPVEEEPDPSRSPRPDIPCGAEPPPSRWLECARRDTSFSQNSRQILRAYRASGEPGRGLDPRYLSTAAVCMASRDSTLNARGMDQRANAMSINRRIQSLLRGREGGYASFRSGMDRLASEVRASNQLMLNGPNHCDGALSECVIVIQDWHRNQQRNPHSVYSVIQN